MSRLAIVNPANHSPVRLRRCGLLGPYTTPYSPGAVTGEAMTSARSAGVLLAHEHPLERVEILEHAPGPSHHAGQRVVGDVHRHLARLGHAPIEPAEQRAAAGEHDSLVHDVGHQLGRRLLDRLLDRLHDLGDRRLERLANLVAADLDAARQTGEQVTPAEGDRSLLALLVGVGRAHGDLDLLGGALAHQQVVLATREADDVGVHLVAADADRSAHDDAAQADDGDLGGATADVDD